MSTREVRMVAGAFGAGFLLFMLAPWIFREVGHLIRVGHHYKVTFAGSVEGLKTGAQITQSGVPVGEVTDVYLSGSTPPQVVVELEIGRKASVRQDSVAMLNTEDDGGLSIEVTGGSAQARSLENNGELAAAEHNNSMA